jgi:hypothetical protein
MNWRELCELAINETDPMRAIRAATAAEQALSQRDEELRSAASTAGNELINELIRERMEILKARSKMLEVTINAFRKVFPSVIKRYLEDF